MKKINRLTDEQVTKELDRLTMSAERVSGFRKDTLFSAARFQEIATVRIVFYYIAYHDVGCTLQQVADYTNRSTAAVFNGIRKTQDYIRYLDVNRILKAMKDDFHAIRK